MKEFNLERALAGDPIVMRCGKPWKYIGTCSNPLTPIVGEFDLNVCFWQKNGRYGVEQTKGFELPEQHSYDLFMAPVKKQEWVNIYSYQNEHEETISYGMGSVWSSEKEAKYEINSFRKYITTVLIREWEE